MRHAAITFSMLLLAACGGRAQFDAVPLITDSSAPLFVHSELRVWGSSPGATFELELRKAGPLSARYDGWCVDAEHEIDHRHDYDVRVYSSYAPLPAGIVDRPGYFDRVNYLINRYQVGELLALGSGGHEPVTVDDMQAAIWSLIDDELGHVGDGWSEARTDHIVGDALIAGKGFAPTCGERIALVLAPENNFDSDEHDDVQVVIAVAIIPPDEC